MQLSQTQMAGRMNFCKMLVGAARAEGVQFVTAGEDDEKAARELAHSGMVYSQIGPSVGFLTRGQLFELRALQCNRKQDLTADQLRTRDAMQTIAARGGQITVIETHGYRDPEQKHIPVQSLILGQILAEHPRWPMYERTAIGLSLDGDVSSLSTPSELWATAAMLKQE